MLHRPLSVLFGSDGMAKEAHLCEDVVRIVVATLAPAAVMYTNLEFSKILEFSGKC